MAALKEGSRIYVMGQRCFYDSVSSQLSVFPENIEFPLVNNVNIVEAGITFPIACNS